VISTHYNCTCILVHIRYNGYQVFPWGKTAGEWRWPPTPSSAEVKERVELYLYSLSRASWPVLGWNLPLRLPFFLFSSPWRWQHEGPKYVFDYYIIKLRPLTQVHFLVPLNSFIHLIHARNMEHIKLIKSIIPPLYIQVCLLLSFSKSRIKRNDV
jgi:hypothetical protein